MADENTKYLLDLDGAKTLYDEIMRDVGGKKINVSSQQELDDLTADDLLGTNTVILVYE